MKEMKFDVIQTNGVINVDFEALERQLDQKLAEYKGAQFSEETKDIAKKEVASLRKFKTAINDRKKEVKELYMQPYTQFEAAVKNLMAKVDEPITLISKQIQEFEENRIQNKRADIRKIYSEKIGTYAEYLPFEKLYDAKWDNAGISLRSITRAIEEAVNKVATDLSTLEMMQSDVKDKAIAAYKCNRNLAEAIQVINSYEAQKAEVLRREEERTRAEEERKAEAERERIRRDERRAVENERKVKEEAAQEAIEAIKSVDTDVAEPLICKESVTVVYTVVATPQELEEIEMAFNSLGVYFERKDV